MPCTGEKKKSYKKYSKAHNIAHKASSEWYTVEQRAKRLSAAFQKLVIKHNKAQSADLISHHHHIHEAAM